MYLHLLMIILILIPEKENFRKWRLIWSRKNANQKRSLRRQNQLLDSSLFNSSGNLDVNINYQYEDNDIQAILFARLQQLRIQNPKLFIKPIEIRAAIDNIWFAVRGPIKTRGKISRRIYLFLISCNSRQCALVGILLEFGEKAEKCGVPNILTRLQLFPSFLKPSKSNKEFILKRIFQTRTLSQQHDSTSVVAHTQLKIYWYPL